MKILVFPALLCSLGLLTGCLPEETSQAPGTAAELTPRDVETALDAFVGDLGRVLAVTEPLEDDAPDPGLSRVGGSCVSGTHPGACDRD